MLLTRGVEGFITTDMSIKQDLGKPTVAVAGHERMKGVTNIVLDEKAAARYALSHLQRLGHEDIAFMIGDPYSSDSAERWTAIRSTADELGVRIQPELTVQIAGGDPTPHLGYPFAKQLLARNQQFTALFAYNDISAIGAMWAFREAGLRVPEDISVVGFDDIPLAAFSNPGLTTVRQPMQRMGQIAAKTVIDQIEGKGEYVPDIVVEPDFIVRASTAPVSRRLDSHFRGNGPPKRAEEPNAGGISGKEWL